MVTASEQSVAASVVGEVTPGAYCPCDEPSVECDEPSVECDVPTV